MDSGSNSYRTEDVVEALSGARNLNAAVKNFLKREVSKGSPSEKFAKEFKKALSSPSPDQVSSFVDRSRERHAAELQMIGSYAYSEYIDSTVEKIITELSDAFNESYQQTEDGIDIKDEKSFKEIAGKAIAQIDASLEEHKIPGKAFLRQITMGSLFDPGVLKKVQELL